MIEGNLLIKASAGTGKTFSLATRFIRLMLFEKASPEKIVALTFSRAAAHEIYTKILERLWNACDEKIDEAGETGAMREKKFLLDGLSASALETLAQKKIDWRAAHFKELLARLVSTQHLGAIATLDSFILRIVSNFPLEMGFQHAVAVLDGAGEIEALKRAMGDLLRRPEVGSEFREAFRSVNRGEFPRTCRDLLERFLVKEGWRAFVQAHPTCSTWTVESMAHALGLPSELPELAWSKFRTSCSDEKFAEALIEFVESYKGDEVFLDKNKRGKCFVYMLNHPESDSYVWSTPSGKEMRLDFGPEGARVLRNAMTCLITKYLKYQLTQVMGKIRLALLVERQYHQSTRQAGQLTFQDFTEYSARCESGKDELKLENLEFRFDSRFDHWALDEFQDTSEAQWQCLSRLVRAAAGGDGRTVLIVGDQKQSIYTWRGASAAPFEEVLQWPEFDPSQGLGKIVSLDLSHRYQKYTAAFVNQVFGSENKILSGTGWEDYWTPHQAKGENDQVRVVSVTLPEASSQKASDEAAENPICRALYWEVNRVWAKHAGKEDSVGILVRNNEKGLLVAEYLRQKGIPVVWEGMNGIVDVPIVQAVLALLKLSEHPGDTFAWKMVDCLYPIRVHLMNECHSVEAVSAKVARALSCYGLARTLQDFCHRLGLAEPRLDDYSRERLAALVRAAVAFEARMTSGGVTEFLRYLETTFSREWASSTSVVRVLTIHRSKGLSIDHVFVPLFETDNARSRIDRPKFDGVLYDPDAAWVLPHLPEGVERFNAKTAAAYMQQCQDVLMENLRTYYVALTRSRKALTVIFAESQKSSGELKGLRFRDVLKAGLAASRFEPRELLVEGEVYGRLLYEAGSEPTMKVATPLPRIESTWPTCALTRAVMRSAPSGAPWGEGLKAGSLLATQRASASSRGQCAHEKMAAIEWRTPENESDIPVGLRSVFERPSSDATVWRERGYELLVKDHWETGQIDRVVFKGVGNQREATIYDFKTNRPRKDESSDDFEKRLVATYAGQMRAYRRAVHYLTGLAENRIQACLVLIATEKVVSTNP